ncbi:transglycosylase domain-containing protein [Myxococcus sp. Y35]|uniref:transglycosylase domain-containing protein n=1 Tax=Pseudomyxococcus flavus TaxID=3115648 RepID=UPI003CF70F36
MGGALAVGLVGTGVLVAIAFAECPRTEHLARETPPRTSYMRRAIADGRLDEGYALQWTAADALPARVLCAVMMAEDPLFFRHQGFNYSLMLTAVVARLVGDTVGSSTLSQQLARNLFLGPEQTVPRKLREAVIAHRLEKTLGKRRILELYVNLVEWGPGVWGITHASQHYWRKRPDELTVFEAVFLASLLPAPSRPLAGANLERSAVSQRIVLDVLYSATVIDADEWRLSLQRLEATYRALQAGLPVDKALSLPLAEALALPAGRALPVGALSPREPRPLLSEGRLLDEQCGLAHAEAHFGPF